ncbi:MAG: 3-ketoacyl-ACP reductase [Planctomycetota bacterium]|jgi:NAD(P)-dependent dehydrogenase (short-subunit alcohol dehydrogenase family)
MASEKVALITGASRGIGKGIALEVAKAGYKIVVNATSKERGQDTVDTICSSGGEAWSIGADISDASARDAMVFEIMEKEGRIDLLVNNAGVAPNVRADILEADEESFDRLININLKGPYFLSQLVANEMIKCCEKLENYAPAIINISSISAYTASPNRGDYCISKAGIGMMTKLFASRLAEYGINVYEIRPGIIATDMTSAVTEKYDKLINDGLTPIKRWGSPEDIGRAVASIAKGDFPFSTGEIINVDGGFHLQVL